MPWKRVKYGCESNPGVYDTGNGAIKIIEENPSYPGVERITVTSYCGRDWDNGRWYRKGDRTFTSLKEAVNS